MTARLPDVGAALKGALSLKITVLSFLAAVSVAFLHFSQWLPTDTVFSAVFRDAIAREMAFFSVSFFFIVSGFLMAKSYDGTRNWYRSLLMRRSKTLLVPYLFWGILGGAAISCLSHRTYSWPGEVLFWLGVNPHSLMPRMFSFWYIRNLIALCVISPLLIRLVLWLDATCVMRCLAVSVFAALTVLDFPCRDQFAMSTAYFCIGIFLAFNFRYVQKHLNLWIVGLVLLMLCAIKCLARYYAIPGSLALHWSIIPVTIVFLWSFYDLVVSLPGVECLFNDRRARFVFSLSLPLYAVHTLVMEFVPGDFIVAQNSMMYPFVMTLFSFLLAMAWVLVFKFVCPVVNSIAFGGRS